MAAFPIFSSTATLLCLFSLLFVLSTSSDDDTTTAATATIIQVQRRSLTTSGKILNTTDEGEEYPSQKPTFKKEKTNSSSTTTTTTDAKTKNEAILLKTIKPKKKNSSSTTTSGKLSSTPLKKTLINSTSRSLKPANSTKLMANPIRFNSISTITVKKINLNSLNTTSTKKNGTTATTKTQQAKQQQQQKPRSKSLPKPEKKLPLLDETDVEDSDLVSEFRDLPSKFQETLLPDLEHLSTKSKAYFTLASTFKPIVGNKYASTVASAASAALLILPLALFTLLFHQLRHFLSLQKILLSVQIYLATYFSILSLTGLLTGLEPLRFFHATSPGSYVYTQVLQTLGFVLYLLLQLMNLVVVFSGEGGLGPRTLGLAQVIVGLAIGLHYYAAVFHRALLGEPPKTNWKIHAVYATCFIMIICSLARAEKRKKAYLQDGGGDYCKKS